MTIKNQVSWFILIFIFGSWFFSQDWKNWKETLMWNGIIFVVIIWVLFSEYKSKLKKEKQEEAKKQANPEMIKTPDDKI